MDNSLISILTPVFNQEKFIGKTIDSVIDQTYRNWEMLIVDDCSTDDSWEIIKKFSLKDERIKIFRNEENIGLVKNWEFLIGRAKGEYIAFLEGDDILLPENFTRKIEIFEKYPEVRMVYCNLAMINEMGKYIIKDYYQKLKVRSYKNERVDPIQYLLSFNQPFISFSQLMIKKDVLKISGLPRSFDPQEKVFLTSDWDFCFRISTKAKIYFIDRPLLQYRKYSASNSVITPKVSRHFLVMLDDYEKEFKNNKRVLKAIKYMRGKTYFSNAVYYMESGLKKKARKTFFIYIRNYPGNFFRDFLMNCLLIARLSMPKKMQRYLKNLYLSS